MKYFKKKKNKLMNQISKKKLFIKIANFAKVLFNLFQN